MSYSPEEDQAILKYRDEDQLTFQEIADALSGISGAIRSADAVRAHYNRLKEKEPVKPSRFSVDDQIVTWTSNDTDYELTLDEVDQIFYMYSKHGLNMHQVQVQNRCNMSAIMWQSFKRAFSLVKDSDVFSPYTLSLYNGKHRADLISAKIAEKYDDENLREVIVYEDNKRRKVAMDKAINKLAQREYDHQKLESAILGYVSEPKEVVVKRSDTASKGCCKLVVADLHVGADIKGEKNLPEYNPSVVENYLSQAAEVTNEDSYESVHLVINGDLLESFTGLSHINSWKNLSRDDGYGVDAVIKCVELLEGFCESIYNLGRVSIVSGNHDRVSSDNKEDLTGEAAKLIWYVLKGRFDGSIAFDWSKDVMQDTMDNMSCIFTHGHHGISKKSPESIINHYGVPGLFNLVTMAHLHTRKILSDNIHNRVQHGPSLFTGNDYSKNLGYSTCAGFQIITSRSGLPDIRDVSIGVV